MRHKSSLDEALDKFSNIQESREIPSQDSFEESKQESTVNENSLKELIAPFPKEHLPEFLREYCAAVEHTTACPDEFLVGAVLPIFSAGIGTRSYASVGSRKYYPTFWVMNVAASSVHYKSTAGDLARPLLEWQEEHLSHTYDYRYEKYEEALAEYEALDKKSKVGRKKPELPVREEIIFADDETLESKYQTLHDSPLGGVAIYDEIAGFINGFDRYSGKKGNVEINRWLSIFDNRPFKCKRKTDKALLDVKKPFSSIVGATTVKVFKSFYNDTFIDSGFLPRFLFNFCPEVTKSDDTYFKASVDGRQLEKSKNRIKNVMSVKDKVYDFSDEAKILFDDWYNRHNQQVKILPESLRAYWKRYESYALKLCHICQVYHNSSPASSIQFPDELITTVDVDRVEEALRLIEYFKGQAVKIYLHFNITKHEKSFFDLTLKIIKILKNKKDLTVREIQRAIHGSPKAEDVEAVLGELRKVGLL